MITIDRSLKHNNMNSSKFFSGKRAVDYLNRNKRAVKKAPVPVNNKQKPQLETRIRKNPPKQTVTRPTGGKTKAAPDSNTVTISKSYLESLLTSTTGPGRQESAIVPPGVQHVHLDSSQVPGLESTTHPSHPPPSHVTYPQPQASNMQSQHPHYHSSHPPPTHTLPPSHAHSTQAPQPKLTAKEQWLKDLAEQVKEKKSREQKQTRKVSPPGEVYFPFGRPGCGAPIRTDTGEVMADLRTILRSSNEGPVQQLVREQAPPEKEYFPYGRPGCGAPNEGPVQQLAQVREQVPPEKEYFPYGRPGCGAPNGENHGHSYQPYGDNQTTQYQHLDQARSQYTNRGQVNASTSHQYNGGYQQQGPGTRATNTHHGGYQQQSKSKFQDDPAQAMVSPREGFARGAGPYVDKYVQRDLDQRRMKELDYRAELANQIAAQKHEKEAKRLAKEREEAIEEARLAQERERLKLQFRREAEEKKRKEELAIQRHKLLQQGIEKANRAALLAKNKPQHAIPSTHSPGYSKPITMGMEQSSVSLSSKFDSVIRSPSMLQLKKIPKPGRENLKRVSRIPVRSTPKREASETRVRTRVQRSEYIPPASPPIPTIAKRTGHSKLQYEMGRNDPAPVNYTRSISPPIPTLAKKMSRDKMPLSYDQGQVKLPGIDQIRSHSPPVPTLAKKISHEAFPGSHDRAQSPPVPTLAKRINSNIEQSAIPINRQPSCEPTRDDLPSPTLVANSRSSNSMGPSRQQVILEQLAALKKGILSHQSTIDDRVSRLVAKKRPNF